MTTRTTRRTILVAIDVETIADTADLEGAVEARLGEFYPDADGIAVPTAVRVVATSPEVAKHMSDALWVGLGNEDELGDAALDVSHRLLHIEG